MKNSKKDLLWYILGSICNAATSALLLIVTIRFMGTIEAGIITISFTIAQQMLIIGRFEVRSYQITDAENKYTFNEYFLHRIIFCAIMILSSIIYIALKNYSKDKWIIIFSLCIYKTTEAFSDVFQGQFQKQGNLARAGKTMALREGIFILVYSVSLYLTHNMVTACLLGAISAILWLFLFDCRYLKEYNVQISHIKFIALTKACFPIFISVFTNTYIINASKYAIDKYAGDQMQSYYNMLFLPVSIINLLSIIIFFPMMTELAILWNTQKYESVIKTIKKTLCIISILSGIVLLFGAILGIPILTFLYGVELLEFRISFVILLLGGWCVAIAGFLNRILILLRKQKFLIYIYLLTAIIEKFLSQILVIKFGILGASVAYSLGMFVLVIVILEVIRNILRKVRNK